MVVITIRSALPSGWLVPESQPGPFTERPMNSVIGRLGARPPFHDLHATMLHLLGVDHTRLTFRFGGRDMRLTDVHGKIVEPILA